MRRAPLFHAARLKSYTAFTQKAASCFDAAAARPTVPAETDDPVNL